MRPYINQIQSNLKSPCADGADWSLEIAPKTLLVGSNTSHKSSVIQSLELALAGSADDVIGRNAGTDASLLLTLAPGDKLGVTAHLTDDTVATYLAQQVDGAVKRPTHAGPGSGALVHRQVREVLGGSATTQRKAFLRWASLDVQLDDILAHLRVEVHATYTDLAQHLGRDKDAVATLLAVIDYAGKRSRELAKEARGAEVVINEIGANLQSKPTQETYDKVRAAVDTLQDLLERAIQVHNPAGVTRRELDKSVAEAEHAVSLWTAEVTRRSTQLESISGSLPVKPSHVEGAIASLDWAITHNVDNCPTCNSVVGNQHIQTCRFVHANTLDAWAQQNASIIDGITDGEQALKEAQNTLGVWEKELARLDSLAVVPEEASNIPTVKECRDRLNAARQALSSTEVAAGKWNQLIAARKRGEALITEQSNYKDLVKMCNEAVGKILQEQVSCFCADVRSYLPDGWEFQITLKAEKHEVFRMGLMREGRLHCALSGAEWVAVTTAIAMAVCQGVHRNEPVLLVPEDRAWDSVTLAAVMQGYADFDGQVVIASTVKPSGRTPKGWQIVDMDATSAAWRDPSKVVPDEASPQLVEEVPSPKAVAPKKTPTRRRRKVTKATAEILASLGYTVQDIRFMTKQTAADILRDSVAPDKIIIQEDGTYTSPA